MADTIGDFLAHGLRTLGHSDDCAWSVFQLNNKGLTDPKANGHSPENHERRRTGPQIDLVGLPESGYWRCVAFDEMRVYNYLWTGLSILSKALGLVAVNKVWLKGFAHGNTCCP
jgi:hypothetical protein